jgi:hypothetical protein
MRNDGGRCMTYASPRYHELVSEASRGTPRGLLGTIFLVAGKCAPVCVCRYITCTYIIYLSLCTDRPWTSRSDDDVDVPGSIGKIDG